MRFTFILPDYPWKPIGGFRVVYEYANQLVIRGHQVTVVHSRPLVNISSGLRANLERLRNAFITPKVNWQKIDHRVKMLYVPGLTAEHIPDADIVFATSWRTAEFVNEYPQSKGAKFYLIQHYESWGGPQSRVNATWRMPFKKIVIAEWLYRKGIELGVKPEEMYYIPYGVDHNKFRLINPIEQRPKRIAMMYHTIEWKGSRGGIQALQILHARHPEVKAILFGVVRLPRDIPSWIIYRHNPSQKELVERIYNGSSIYMCSSWTEGFHMPPTEAMACGCALVSTDIDGVSAYAKHNVTALLSPPKDPEGLAGNLATLIENDKLRIKLAKQGNERIWQFTWERSVDLLEVFLSLKGYKVSPKK